MVSKWFIGVSAKSKGYFKGFDYISDGYYHTNKCKLETNYQPRPRFTKQTALARSYPTEQAALRAVKKYRDESTTEITDAKKRIKAIESIRPTWFSLSTLDRYDFCSAYDMSVGYQSTSKGWNGKAQTYMSYLTYYNTTRTKLSKEEKEALKNNINWDSEIIKSRNKVNAHTARLKYIVDKLIVREADLEFKFMDSQRKKIVWVHRKENDTAYGYCNCCGGAIPGIPQLHIGYDTVICAICMAKLADEAKTQAGKVPDEVLEHYNTDRFLRSI